MKTNPILEEVWRIKDELAREAGYDIDRYCEQLRAWTAAHPHPGPRVSSAEELRRLLAEVDRKRAEESALILNDAPPRPARSPFRGQPRIAWHPTKSGTHIRLGVRESPFPISIMIQAVVTMPSVKLRLMAKATGCHWSRGLSNAKKKAVLANLMAAFRPGHRDSGHGYWQSPAEGSRPGRRNSPALSLTCPLDRSVPL